MPLQAKMCDKLAVLRGVRTVGNHTGNEFFSGFPFEQGKLDAKTNEQRPAFGCVVSKMRGGQAEMPPYVSLHDVDTWELPVYAGKAHAPLPLFQPEPEAQGADRQPEVGLRDDPGAPGRPQGRC